MSTRPMALALVAVMWCSPAHAQTVSELHKSAANLNDRAVRTIHAIDDYFTKAPTGPVGGTSARDRQTNQFRGFVRVVRDAMELVARESAAVAAVSGETDAGTFGVRVGGSRVAVGDLVDLASRAGFQRFFPEVGGAPPCCDELTKAAAPLENTLAISFASIWKDFGVQELASTIDRATKQYENFEKKLLKGFPAMPWEYMLNLHGKADGPSRHQIIWFHPSLGFEVDNKAAAGTSQSRAVLAIQAIGYNYYFFKGINYVGATAILTVNATAERDRWRKGAAFHFGNIASVGATRGDGRWIVFVASDRLGDKLVGALVRLR